MLEKQPVQNHSGGDDALSIAEAYASDSAAASARKREIEQERLAEEERRIAVLEQRLRAERERLAAKKELLHAELAEELTPVYTPQAAAEAAEADAAAEPDVPDAAEEPDVADTPDAAAITAEEPDGEQAATPFWRGVLQSLRTLVPCVGDRPVLLLRKGVFLLAMTVLVGSVGYIYQDTLGQAIEAARLESVVDGYINDGVLTPEQEEEYKKWTERNPDANPLIIKLKAYLPDTRGYLTFGNNSLLPLNEKPVMQSTDNVFYLTHDIERHKAKTGSLFVDYRNNLAKPDTTTIIYGHNLTTRDMFTGFNDLVKNVNNARTAVTVKFDTIYGPREYKVFAIVMIDEDAKPGDSPLGNARFNYLRMNFDTDGEFISYVDNLRARSLYNYGDVDVRAGDELLLMSTCSNTRQAHYKNGRVAVVARRVREGENAAVSTAKVTENKEVIMPYKWYTAQKKTPHKFYTDKTYKIPSLTKTRPNPPPTAATTGAPTTTGTAGTTTTGRGTTTRPPDNTTTAPPNTTATTAATDTPTTPTAPPPTDGTEDTTLPPTDATDPPTEPVTEPATEPTTAPTTSPTETDPAE